MATRFAFPEGLAGMVLRALTGVTTRIPPTAEVLTKIFETMYFASLQTEEGRATRFDIVYLDPENPYADPDRTRWNEWQLVGLSKCVPFDVDRLTKLAQASDPRTSALVVYPENEDVFVWGLVDQGNRHNDYINREIQLRPSRPGLFQAGIVEPGRIAAYASGKRIAELRSGELSTRLIDALQTGQVRTTLEDGFPIGDRSRVFYRPYLQDLWITQVRRVLLRVQNFRHGGAVLVTPESADMDLDVRFSLDYQRLPDAIRRFWNTRLAISDINAGLLASRRRKETIPADFVLHYAQQQRDLEIFRDEIAGIVWFMSLLTRVDGLVVMTPSLTVKGFGVFVKPGVDKPPEIFTTTAAKANQKRLSRLDYDHFGTRHQSMIRYCAKHPGSVGFVVSQDGGVRAMTSVEGKLVVWENVNLQNIRQLREPELRVREVEVGYERIYESKWREVDLPSAKPTF